MREKQCEVIRRELEEVALNDEFSGAAAEHLRGCADCREFQRQQTKLRQIVGSLGTVNAPADFDFRLRARLAADSERSGSAFLVVCSARFGDCRRARCVRRGRGNRLAEHTSRNAGR